MKNNPKYTTLDIATVFETLCEVIQEKEESIENSLVFLFDSFSVLLHSVEEANSVDLVYKKIEEIRGDELRAFNYSFDIVERFKEKVRARIHTKEQEKEEL